MKLFASLYLDEDVDILLMLLLQARGFDVLTARDAHMLRRSDEQQLAYAASVDRALLTHNRVDFEDLHTAYITTGKHHAGVSIAAGRNPYQLAARVALLLDSVTADEAADQIMYI